MKYLQLAQVVCVKESAYKVKVGDDESEIFEKKSRHGGADRGG